MQIFICVLCFYFAFFQAGLQGQNPEIVHTDADMHPEVRVFVKYDTDSLHPSEFKIRELGKSKIFSADTIPAAGMPEGSDILFILKHSNLSDTALKIPDAVFNAMQEQLNEHDRVNFAYYCAEDSGLCRLEFLAPDFSRNFNFFQRKIKSLSKARSRNEADADLCSLLLKAIHSYGMQEGSKSNKAIIFIADSIGAENISKHCQTEMSTGGIPVYFLFNKIDSIPDESSLIDISAETGGIYTISGKDERQATLENYITDIGLHNISSDDKVLVLKFRSEQNEQRNEFSLIHKEDTLRSFYIKKEKNENNNTNPYLLIIIALLPPLFVFSLFKASKTKKNKAKKEGEELKQSNKTIIPKSFPEITISSEEMTKNFILTGKITSIGRSPKNSISLPDTTLSAIHAKITREGDKYFIEDLDSTNGTIVNGRRVEKARLKHKDFVKLGKLSLKFYHKK